MMSRGIILFSVSGKEKQLRHCMPKLLFFLLYEVNYKLDRAVIRTENIGVDGCLF